MQKARINICLPLAGRTMAAAIAVAAGTLGFASAATSAQTMGYTGIAGSESLVAVSNFQPSLAIRFSYPRYTIYGFGLPVRMFAYSDATWNNLTSAGWMEPDGRLLNRVDDEVLFLQLGETYGGGDGSTTFAIPDLRGRSPMGEGQGPGLPNVVRGQQTGAASVTLMADNLPIHSHDLAAGGQTGAAGSGASFFNLQPGLALGWAIATVGVFPSWGNGLPTEQGSISSAEPFYAQLELLTAPTPNAQYMIPCDGRAVTLSQNSALFSLLGTSYGGNGVYSFSLPDTRGRLLTSANGANRPMSLPSHLAGDLFGNPSVSLDIAQMPAHSHTVPSQGPTALAGGYSPFDNQQPTATVSFYLALGGVYPGSSGMSDLDGYVGEIVAMASNFAPYGFAPCDGRLLLRSDYPSLFSLIGTSFGGDGVTYFAVPDLRSRVPVMTTAALPIGTAFGEQATYLAEANLPAHRHTVLLSACSLADVAGGGPTGLGPDGVVDGSDFIAFINSFGTGDIGADALADVAGGGPDGLEPDGVMDGGDFVAFVNAFAAGC